MLMALIARIVVLSLLAGALGAGLGLALFQRYDYCGVPCFLLACVGGVVGAVAGTAREIVAALQQGRSS